jgi:hypothetical protein
VPSGTLAVLSVCVSPGVTIGLMIFEATRVDLCVAPAID